MALPVTFPMVMAFGGFLGLIRVRLPGVELGIALSAFYSEQPFVLQAHPKLIFAMILVGCFGLFHGHAHGTGLPTGQSGLLYSMGFVIATGSLHAIGICLGLINRWPIGNVASVRASLHRFDGCLFPWGVWHEKMGS